MTRRETIVFLASLSTVAAQEKKAGKSTVPSPILGICSTSFGLNTPAVEPLIEAAAKANMRVLSLGAPHFDPWGATAGSLPGMRTLRTKFSAAGILVRSVSVQITPGRAEAEISRMLAMANALDVRHVTADAPVAMLPTLNELARKHAMVIALRTAGELTSVSEVQTALHTYGNLGIAIDAPQFTAAGADPADLIRGNAVRVFEIRFRPGDARITDLISRVRFQHPNIPMLIDVASPAEIGPALEFFRTAIRQKPPAPPRPRKPGSTATKD